MFGLYKTKKATGEQVSLTIHGMHCTSCSMNIDGELEETEGIIESSTSYAKARTEILYDPKVVSIESIQRIIESLGYSSTSEKVGK